MRAIQQLWEIHLYALLHDVDEKIDATLSSPVSDQSLKM